MPCRWSKVASVEIISLSGVHHLFYDFVFVIVSYTLSFFFRNFKSKRIANNFLNQKTGVLFSKLSERNAWMIPNLGKKNTKSIFVLYTSIFCSFPELTISLTDLAIIGKKRHSIKLTLIKQGFFLSREQFSFELIFLSRSAANIASSTRITDRWILWLLGRESCTLYWFVNAIQLTALKLKIC